MPTFLDKRLEVGLLDHMIVLFVIFWGTSVLFPEQLYHLAFPPTVHEGFNFATSSPTLVFFPLCFSANCCWWVLMCGECCAKHFTYNVSINPTLTLRHRDNCPHYCEETGSERWRDLSKVIQLVSAKAGLFFFFFFLLFGAAPPAQGGAQGGGELGLQLPAHTTAHSSAGSSTHWTRPGLEPASSWMLVRFANRWAMMGTPKAGFWTLVSSTLERTHPRTSLYKLLAKMPSSQPMGSLGVLRAEEKTHFDSEWMSKPLFFLRWSPVHCWRMASRCQVGKLESGSNYDWSGRG